MVWLTRLDGSQVLVNETQVTLVEPGGETLVVLANGDRLRVLESAEEIAARIVAWQRRIGPATAPWLPGED